MTDQTALKIRGLSVGYRQLNGVTNPVVWDVDLDLERGTILGVAGESGCGKSTTALAAIGYRPGAMTITGGASMLGPQDLLGLKLGQLRNVWGSKVVYVAQASSSALTPAVRIGAQLAESLTHHLGLKGEALRQRQIQLLTEVGVPDPESALRRYPHQFSGGQQQRICLAIALSCEPDVLILDEPTTGLDVTTQARIVKLLKRVVAEHNTAAMFVSHDLPLLADVADRIAIMYGGQVIEHGSWDNVLLRPQHPYTKALLAAIPDAKGERALVGIPGAPPTSVVMDACSFAKRCEFVQDGCTTANPPLVAAGPGHEARCVRIGSHEVERVSPPRLERVEVSADVPPVFSVKDLCCEYRSGSRTTPVVKSVSFDLAPGETLAIVGESGSGKSTLVRALAGLHPPTSGSIEFDGQALEPGAAQRSRAARRDVQIIFQNPDTSLNPRHDVFSLIARPFQLFQRDLDKNQRRTRVLELLDAVNLPASMLHRYPAELSGGQKQRIAIARAFACDPRVILADEITSALDVSVQAAILTLLSDLSRERGTSVLFVSHDLAVVRAVAQRALVLQRGEVEEIGSVEQLFAEPSSEYTRQLVQAIPAFVRIPNGESRSIATGAAGR